MRAIFVHHYITWSSDCDVVFFDSRPFDSAWGILFGAVRQGLFWWAFANCVPANFEPRAYHRSPYLATLRVFMTFAQGHGF